MNSKATHYVMMVASDDERVCSLWQFSGIDKDKQEYVIWIEDTSGKVIAFEIPFSYMGKTDENFYISLDALSNYYGFSTFGLNEHFINVYKIEYWENEMVLIDEIVGEKIEVMLYKNGDKLFFNMYPKMHDYSESKTY